jgi:hypothetical protein
LPVPAAYCPAPQAPHSDRPVEAAILPSAHEVQLEAAAALYLPLAQLTQLEAPPAA